MSGIRASWKHFLRSTQCFPLYIEWKFVIFILVNIVSFRLFIEWAALEQYNLLNLIQQLSHHWRLCLTQAFLFILFLFVHRFTIHSHCLHLKVYEDVKLITKHCIFNSTIIFLRLHNPGRLYFFNGHAVKSSMHYEHLNSSPNSYIWLTGLPCWAVEIALECGWRVLQWIRDCHDFRRIYCLTVIALFYIGL